MMFSSFLPPALPRKRVNNMSDMPDHEAKVAKRFRKVSLDNPINALLHEMALRIEKERAGGPDFSENMNFSLPDPGQYLEMKRKMTLLPLETVEQRVKLPALPGTVIQLQDALEKKVSSTKLAHIIGPDIKMTTAIMSLINSPMYGLPSKVETLSRALTILGANEISSLALGARILAMFEDSTPEGIPVSIFMRHSIACAELAHGIAGLCGEKEREKFFVAGLLHDLGRVILFSNFPDMAKVTLALHQLEDVGLNDAEMQTFGVAHGMVGGVFFGKWGLPQSVINAALFHHSPGDCIGKKTAEVVYVANQVANALGFGCDSTYTLEPGDAVWEALDITDEALFGLLVGVDERLCNLFASIFPESCS